MRTSLSRPKLAMLAIACAVLCGCATVREEVDEPEVATLVTARTGSEVTLQWQTERGTIYSVLYADRLSGGLPWQPVPGLERVEGTGGLVQFKDSVSEGTPRYYRLKVMPARVR